MQPLAIRQNAQVPTMYKRFSVFEGLMRLVTWTISPLSVLLYSTTVFTPLASGYVTHPTGIWLSLPSSSASQPI
jgi:hypothetical protein